MTLYHVTDCPFNRAWYADLIGRYFLHVPSYCVVEIIDIELAA